MDTSLTVGEQKNLENFLKPKLVLTKPAGKPEAAHFTSPVVDLEAEAKEINIPLSDCKLRGDDPAVILFTSGTTGVPKGVVHTKASVAAKLENNIQYSHPEAFDRTLAVLPTHYVSGLFGGILVALAAGGQVFTFQALGIEGAARLGRVLDDYEITSLNSVPSLWKVAMKVSNPPQRKTLRQVCVCASPLNRATWQAIIKWCGTDHVNSIYGTTETGGWNIGASSTDHNPESGLVGTPWSGVAAVLAEDGRIHSTGEGEILLKGSCMMQGYFKRPDLTMKSLHDGWYKTGDLGTIDEAGLVRILGRSKIEINRGGQKVQPEEVEEVLGQCPEVREACIFRVTDTVSGETVGCAVVLEERSSADENNLREWCRTRIRSVCVPEKWYFLPNLPKTEHMKVKRDEVAKMCRNWGA